MVLAITPLSPNFGIEIKGIDLRHALSDRLWQQLLSAWQEAHVVVFRDQHALTDADLLLFSRQLGQLDPAPSFDTKQSHAEGYPEIAVVSNIKKGGQAIGGLGDGELSWHSDMTYVSDPPVACLLHARELPPHGGDTYFLNLETAYASLPLGLRNSIARHRVFHDAGYTSAGTPRQNTAAGAGAWHRLTTTNPLSGRPSLFLGRRLNRIVEQLDEVAGRALLDELWDHAVQDKHILRHRWRPGDLLLWNNIAVMHRRDAFDPSARRLLHRTQIRALDPKWQPFASVA